MIRPSGDDLTVPAPELPGQLPLPGTVPGCDAPGCEWSAVWQLRPLLPDTDLAVILLCEDHLPLAVSGEYPSGRPVPFG